MHGRVVLHGKVEVAARHEMTQIMLVCVWNHVKRLLMIFAWRIFIRTLVLMVHDIIRSCLSWESLIGACIVTLGIHRSRWWSQKKAMKLLRLGLLVISKTCASLSIAYRLQFKSVHCLRGVFQCFFLESLLTDGSSFSQIMSQLLFCQVAWLGRRLLFKLNLLLF